MFTIMYATGVENNSVRAGSHFVSSFKVIICFRK